jgi:hypothetical protein
MRIPDAFVLDLSRSLLHQAVITARSIFIVCGAEPGRKVAMDRHGGEGLLAHGSATLCAACASGGRLEVRNLARVQARASRALQRKSRSLRERSVALVGASGDLRMRAEQTLDGG